jgi:hypothetical protein
MQSKPPSLSPVVRSTVLETVAERLPRFRDATTGVIEDRALTVAVIAALDTECPDIARLGRTDAWAVAVYELVRYFERTSTSRYAVHSREHKAGARRAKARQRTIVTFRSASGEIVKKDRAFLLKREVLLVREQYARIGAAAGDVVTWCDAVWEQMDLRGLSDDAMVSEVLDMSDEDAA